MVCMGCLGEGEGWRGWNQVQMLIFLYARHSLRLCLADTAKEIRVAGFRALRHLIQSEDDVRVIMRMHLEIFIVRYEFSLSPFFEACTVVTDLIPPPQGADT